MMPRLAVLRDSLLLPPRGAGVALGHLVSTLKSLGYRERNELLSD